MKRLLAIIAVAVAMPSHAATYYADWVSGNDGNSGTTTNSPWKRLPFMRGWEGGSFTAQPGDRFILKGGVTWPNAALSMFIDRNGTVSNPIYIGIDTNWYDGDQWVVWTNGWGRLRTNFTYPKLDAGGQSISDTRTKNNIVHINGDNIILDGLELTGVRLTGQESGQNAHWSLFLQGAVNFKGSNLFVHDWVWNYTSGSDMGGVADALSTHSPGASLYHCRIWGPHPSTIASQYKTVPGGLYAGAATERLDLLYDCDIKWAIQGSFGNNVIDGCAIYETGAAVVDSHENGVWMVNSGTMRNSLLRNISGGVGAYLLCGWSGTAPATIWAYNNIFWDTPQINLSQQNSDGTDKLFFFNNIVKQNGTCIQVGTTKTGAPFAAGSIENNIFISEFKYSNPGAVVKILDAADLGSKFTNDNNVVYTTAEANAQGLLAANLWQPQSAVADLLDRGRSYSSETVVDILGVTRPVGAAWDIGPYEFVEIEPNPGNIFVGSPTYSVNESAGSVTVSVIRSGGSLGSVSVNFGTTNLTATAGSDYTATNGVLTWAEDELGVKTVEIAITQEEDIEGNESFIFGIDSATGDANLVAPTTATVTIVDDDVTEELPEIPLMDGLGPFEAEEGLIQSPMTASGGAVFQTVQTTDPAVAGKATYRIDIPSDGFYCVQMWVDAANTASDSLFVDFDQSPTAPTTEWHIPVTSGTEERVVTWRGTSQDITQPEHSPKIWFLTEGIHVLDVRGRESNCKVDKVQVLPVGGAASPPDAPSGLTATVISRKNIRLEWTDNSVNESRFIIERSDQSSDSGFTSIGTNSANTVVFNDTSIASAPISFTYWYRVFAETDEARSEYSNVASADTVPAGAVRLRLRLRVEEEE